METSSVPSDLVERKIEKFDTQIYEMQDAILALNDQIKIMQHYIVKLAQNQAALTKQLAQWPYITVPDIKPSVKKEKPEGPTET